MSRKVCVAFDGELQPLADQPQAVQKKALLDQQMRHRHWVKRKVEQGRVEWRPKKKHRVSAAAWCCNVDNQLKRSLGLKGFIDFKPAAGSKWRERRHLALAIDQGSDGLSAMNYLLFLGICLTPWMDFSHGANNDINATIKSLGLWPFWLLMLVVLNIDHGPYDDDVRFAQVREGWNEKKKFLNAKTAVFFREYLPRIVVEMKTVLANLDFDGPVEDALWSVLFEYPLLVRKGYKSKVARFMNVRRQLKDLLQTWHLKRCQYEYVAVESGMVSYKNLEKIRAVGISRNDDPSLSSTSPGMLTLDDRLVRNSCSNAVAIAVVMLAEPMHYHLIQIIVKLTQPVDDWHSEQNKTLRSRKGSEKWLVRQHEGDFWTHIRAIVKIMGSAASLADVGILQDAPHQHDNNWLLEQDSLADTMGQFGITLIGKRVSRCLWFWQGLPHRNVAGLSTKNGVAANSAKEFRKDHDAFLALKAAAPDNAAAQALLNRSVFQHAAVELQLEATCYYCLLLTLFCVCAFFACVLDFFVEKLQHVTSALTLKLLTLHHHPYPSVIDCMN